MRTVMLLGAGTIGRAIAKLLTRSGTYTVVAADSDEAALAQLATLPRCSVRRVDVRDEQALAEIMRGVDDVVSACAFTLNPGIARAAQAAGRSYFDLTEDVTTTRAVRTIADRAAPGQIFMPQCGLAPGFIAICGHHLTRGFDTLDELRLRVGALPQFPTGELKYNLTWSTDGLINEYCNPCEVILDGRRIETLALEGLEHFSLDGVDYEAFNTSGGVGSLGETLAGRLRALDYKTIRYRGHRDLIAFLVNELRLRERRALLKDMLEYAVPITYQDVVLVFCSVTGRRGGRLVQMTDARKIYHGEVHGETWSAIQIATAAGICAVLDLHASGKLPPRGFVRQEQVSLDDFLANRFGRLYVDHGGAVSSPVVRG